MALSGNGESIFSSGGNTHSGYSIGIDWKINSQSTSSNSSNITVSMYIKSNGSYYTISSSATKSFTLNINGTAYSASGTVGLSANQKKVLLTKTVNVSHNSDGSKTCAISASAGVKVTLSSKWFDTVSTSLNAVFDKINLNSPPTMSGSISVSPNGIIPENTTTLSLSWPQASDAQGNADKYQLYRYINGTHNATYNYSGVGTKTANIGIAEFGQGTQISFQIKAGDSYGTWSNAISSATVTKNKLSPAWFTGHSNDISWDTTSFTLYFTGASNTNGNTSFKYMIYSDDVTIYNRRDTTESSETITIWRSGATPSGPYIKFEDLKNKFRNSNFKGRMHVGIRTTNLYNSEAWGGGSIGIDLKTTPNAPTSVTITGGTAYKTVSHTTTKYYVPENGDTITFSWAGGGDKIGETHQYKIYSVIDGRSTLLDTVSSSTKTYTYTATKGIDNRSLAFEVYTVTSYGYTNSTKSSAVTLYYHNSPSVELVNMNRTESAVTATIKLKANTSVPGVAFTTRTYSGPSSGTLTDTQAEQTITASGLDGGSTYTWTITLKDNTGLHTTNVTKAITIPGYTPLFSIREKGVGVNAIPDGTAKFIVNGDIRLAGNLKIDSPNGIYKNRTVITTKEGDANGMGIAIQAGGTTVIGGGESAQTFLDSVTSPATEQLHLTSDSSVFVQTNMQSGIDAKKTFEFNVKGDIITPKGTVLTTGDYTSQHNVLGKVANIGTDGVMEVGKYIDFHDTGSTKDYDVRLQCNGSVLEINQNFTVGATLTSSIFNLKGHIQLPSNGGSWIDGATNGNIRGSKQSTGSYHPIISQTTSSNHKISLGGLGDEFGFHLYDAGRTVNGVDKVFRFRLINQDIYTNCRINMDEWLYLNGGNGVYFASYGGGLYMSDTTWIRAWGDKNFYTAGRIKTINALECRYLDAVAGGSLDISTNGSGSILFNLHTGSGCNLYLNRNWSGSSGTEPSLYNSKGVGWGYIGNTGWTFYRVYGAGGSVSEREKKYSITRALEEEQYDNLKNINIYNYRTISTIEGDLREIAEDTLKGEGFKYGDGTYKTESVEWNGIIYEELNASLTQEEIREERIKQIIEKNPQFKEVKRQDLMLGAMIDELPTEVTFYDNEGGDGKAVDMYSYTTMIAGALKHAIQKIETLEKENELKDIKIEELEQRLNRMEELLNGVINKG